MQFEIKSSFTDNVLFTAELSAEYESQSHSVQIGAAVKLAYKADANLRYADLRGADLRDANLRYADLRGANLRYADLRRANLWDADLRDAKLRDADLRGANLRYADLRGANLRYADLRRANLWDADLRGANDEKLTLTSNRPFVQYGPVGSDNDIVYAWGTDRGIYIRRGCFWNTLDKFKAAVESKHGSSNHGNEYRAFIALVEAHFDAFPAEQIQQAAE